MAFYQNISDQEFRGNWVLGDRQYVIEFICPANRNAPNYQLAWNGEPYDLSVANMLTLNYAWDVNFKNYSSLSINIAGVTPAATLASEVVAALNANLVFAEMFVAQLKPLVGIAPQPPFPNDTPNTSTVLIIPKAGRVKSNIRLWITNAGAEQKLCFNKKAGFSDMPTYMDRHTVANRFNFPDSQGCLIRFGHSISSATLANPTVVTSPAHGLTTGDTITVYNSDSTPIIDGSRVVTVIDANTFSVPVNVTVAGDAGYYLTSNENVAIVNAGYDPATMKQDWQLLRGRASGLFMFQNVTVDGSNRMTQVIEYPAGAVAGDFGRRIRYGGYTGANTFPNQITEEPYVLQPGDLVNP